MENNQEFDLHQIKSIPEVPLPVAKPGQDGPGTFPNDLSTNVPSPILRIANQSHHMMGGHNVMIMLEGNEVGQHPDWQQFILEKWGFDYQRPPNIYPFHRYLELVEYLRTKLYGELEPDAGYQKLGYNACQCYFRGISGQILKVAAHVMGPQRGAQQFVKNMQRVLPWDKHELVEIRPGYICYSKGVSEGSPAIMLGFMQASVEATGAKATRWSYYEESSSEGLRVVHEMWWL